LQKLLLSYLPYLTLLHTISVHAIQVVSIAISSHQQTIISYW